MQSLSEEQLEELKTELAKAVCRMSGWINFYDGSIKAVPIVISVYSRNIAFGSNNCR